MSQSGDDDICVLMDEPELHVHPNLQGKILSYLRNISVRDGVQFILATHSSTMIEQANSDELFLLRPAELIKEGENQLVQIASSDEKLQMMRDVFGSTTNITAMKKILVVEGGKAHDGSRRATDERILGFLSNQFSQFTIMSGGGKAECKVLARSLSEILSGELSDRLNAVALVDRDLEEENIDDDGVVNLPVSMIENFLIDPMVIWRAVRLVRHKMNLASEKDVEVAIDAILDERAGAEVERRVKADIGMHVFRAQDPIDEVKLQAAAHVERINEAVSDDSMEKLEACSKATVQRITGGHKRREIFDGKKVLEEFYRRHMRSSGMSKEIFVYSCAKEASDRNSVRKFVDTLMVKMGMV